MTHAEKVLALLSDGQPHTHMEGYRLGVMLHSRVADLRKPKNGGHDIRCWREGENYLYQLLSEPDGAAPGTGGRPVLEGAGLAASGSESDWSGVVRENGNATTDGLAVSDRSPGQPSTAVPPAPQTPESAGASWAGPASPSTVGPAQLTVWEAA